MKWYEVRIPAFRPLWRRIALVSLVFLWALVEIGQGAWIWAGAFVLIGLYLSWAFFLAFEDGPAGRSEVDED